MNRKISKTTRKQYLDHGRSIYEKAQKRYGGEAKLQRLKEARESFQAAFDISPDDEARDLLEHTTETIEGLEEKLGITQKQVYIYPKEYISAIIITLVFAIILIFLHTTIISWIHKAYDAAINYPNLANLSLLSGIVVALIAILGAIYSVGVAITRTIRSRNTALSKAKVPIRK